MKNQFVTALLSTGLILGSSFAFGDDNSPSKTPDMNQLEALLGSLGSTPAPQCAQTNGVDVCNAIIPCCNQSDVCVINESAPESGFCD